ncbi:hypothetical protein SDC9_181736 [bioreactor metagenome]|uniref:Uncharacterized protein n=1 Tax=bioreactor metagenome TaxID=1076179 RepID=A0A645HEW5_9ZZZZ|nr:polysaccharide biosynthesis C-terminal domain-containing protein [Petrimonas sp.]
MPTYMITLVSQFLFLPMLKRYHSIVSTGDRRMIKSLLMRNIGYLAVLTLAASIGIYYLGPLLLGIIYQTELSQFRVEMLIVMLGGGFFAVYQFYYYLFVILKKQKIVLRNLIYGTLFVVPLTYVFIHWFGMIGACAAYTITLLLLALLFATSFHTALIKSGDGDSSKRAVECAEEVGERIKQDLVI